jgi:hypothetical protein
MDSPQKQPVSDNEARRLAKTTVRLFRSPLKVVGIRGFDEPVTIADAIRLGGILLGALNVANGRDWLKEKNREFVTKIAEYIYQPEAMEEFLYVRIKERAESENEILEAISQVEEQMAGPGAIRRFIKKAMAEAMPKARRGRPTEFNPASDPDRFLSLSSQLAAACGQFLGLQVQFPRKSSREIIDFIKPENPNAAEILRKREGYIALTMNDSDFQLLKTQETKARRLADAIAGKELFDWSVTYAVQRGGEFRRSKGIESEE